MSRTPNAIAQETPIQFDDALLAQDAQAALDLAQMKADYAEGRDLANQLLGQVQMADSLSKFTMTVSVSKLAYVKEHKLYKALKGKKTADGQQFSGAFPIESADKTADGQQFSGTWEEYCALLGRSHQQVDEEIRNLKTFGEAALESMSAMGIGYRELRQYRKLPADQQMALIEVAKVGDKEGFVELAEEIIAKHAKEKEAHAAALTEAQANLAAKQRALDASSATIANLHEQLGGEYEPRPGSIAKSEQEENLLEEISAITLECGTMMRRLFLAADTTFDAPVGEGVKNLARQAVEYLCQELASISVEFGIKVDFENLVNPPWMSEAMVAAMQTKRLEAAAQAAAKAQKRASGKPGTPADTQP